MDLQHGVAAGRLHCRGWSAWRPLLWRLAKWLLTAVVLAFVGIRAFSLWRADFAGGLELHWGWLFLSGLIYSLAWIPNAGFYRAVLRWLGDDVSWATVIHAYYVGLMGKYVPGKALVPVIRGQMVAQAGGRFSTGALGVVYEALVMMGVGVEITLALLFVLVRPESTEQSALLRDLLALPGLGWLMGHPILLPVAVCGLVAATLPVVAWLFTIVARRLTPGGCAQETLRPISSRLIGTGAVVFAVAWAVQGVALWAALRGLGADVSLWRLPTWTICVAFSTAAGFFALFAPGGIGVREGILLELLAMQPDISSHLAIAAAFLWRAVGFVAEILCAAVLYYAWIRRRGRRSATSGIPPHSPC